MVKEFKKYPAIFNSLYFYENLVLNVKRVLDVLIKSRTIVKIVKSNMK